MIDFLTFRLNRLKEKLWVRPLVMCIISVSAVMLAKAIESTSIAELLPEITAESVEALLTTLTAGMLVIATFAVGSMVSAYATAGNTATPRTFPLMVADDVSQNALSTFIGAFIFSVVALVFQKNGYYEVPGRFVLFVLTCLVFAIVILTFVRWVDRIARLGRLSVTIDKVEKVTVRSLRRRRRAPTLGCRHADNQSAEGKPILGTTFGYVQLIDIKALQDYAEQTGLQITIEALPGTFIAPGRSLARISTDTETTSDVDTGKIENAFLIGDNRTFDDDPRFGLVVLSEIAGKALSPAVNDPGTAIDVIGTLIRLFAAWNEPVNEEDHEPIKYDRVLAPELSSRDMFDDAFTAIARDGAGCVEVATRLQKALLSLSTLNDQEMKKAAKEHSRMALARAENALTLPEDLQAVREIAAFSSTD
ncbi:MAG: DUF2254 domain-containing protein [Phycisphaerales bacterium]